MTGTAKRRWSIALLAAGFTAWSAVFLLIYSAQAVGCRLGWDRLEVLGAISLQRALQVALYLAAIAGTLALYAWLRHRTRDRDDGRGRHAATAFLNEVSAHAGLAALGAVAFCFWGVFWLTAC
jgi:hypothetical protein